jgi:ribonuclease HI
LGVFTNEIGGASAEVNLFLYKACVLPHMEYAYPVWSTVTSTQQLETVQHTAIRRALGAMDKSNVDSMEILAQVLPLDIKLDSNLVITFLGILRKPDTDRLKRLINHCLQKTDTGRFVITPIMKYKMASRYLLDFSPHEIERTHIEDIKNILHRPPILEKFDQNLGNAGSRSKEQAERARLLALDRICQAGEDLFIFTDGSALSNPGPCGAGTVIYWRGITHDRSSYGRPVSKHSNSFHAELQAIDLALQTVTEAYPVIKKPVLLLSDCQGALTVTADPIAPANFTGLYYSIQDKIHTLREQGSDIKLHWIAGHADIEGNEEADIKAKEAATEASSPSFTSMLKSWSEAKARVKSKAMERWKSRRKNQTQNHLLPPHSVRGFKSSMSRIAESRYHRLILGHSRLKDHMHKIMPHAVESPTCSCGSDRETTEHYILHCKNSFFHRINMIDQIQRGFLKTETPTYDQRITLATLIGHNSNYNPEMRSIIKAAVAEFIQVTAPFTEI